MRILFVSFYNTEAYGVRSLHATMVRDSHEARILFFKQEVHDYEKALRKSLLGNINAVTEREIDLFLRYVEGFDPDIIAFSLVSSHFHLFQLLSQKLPARRTIIVGGWEASLNPERCLPYADYVCVGEGEEALSELVKHLQAGEGCEGVRNFWSRQGDRIVKNPVRPLNQDLSSLPIPLFGADFCVRVESDEIVREDPYVVGDRYGTFIGMGCPYQCTYCSNSYMASQVYPKEWSHIRFHNVARMQAELLQVKEKLKQIRVVNFYDEVFSPSTEWMQEFFSWYAREIGIPFCCTFYPGRCSDEMCRILAGAGMKGVWLGVQSGSERVRREIFQRHYSNEKVLAQAAIFQRYGIPVRYDFIFDNPFETFAESLENVGLMVRLPQPFTINQFSLKFFPHTRISERALEAGLIQESEIVDQQEIWQDNYTVAKHGRTMEGSFINRLVSLISLQASRGELKASQVWSLVRDFKASRALEPVDSLLREFIQ